MVQAFIDDLSARQDLNRAWLAQWLERAHFRQDIIDAISKPAEAKPWYKYRPIFVNPARITDGVNFWNAHASLLKRAADQYGVPPEIIVAIIGVETRYGQNNGGYLALDALATLAFGYPKRAPFFRKELEQLFLLARDERLDLAQLKGSYAGALGVPQFMPSSYRNYAIDFDGDGHRDLLSSAADAIGSVANYFKGHGWQTDGRVVLPLPHDQVISPELVNTDLKPTKTLAELRTAGLSFDSQGLPPSTGVALLDFEVADDKDYWLCLTNFYVITRYNGSKHYAMAVYQLAQEILAQRSRLLSR